MDGEIMSILKFKNPDGTWKSVTAIQGEPGKDGAIQYKPGKGINITEDNVIEAEFEDITVDETPVEGSNNPVSSGGVFEALENVNPNIQFTEMPDPNTFDPNKVIQYVGETNEQFTKGYWYKIGNTEIKEKLLIPAGEGHLTGIVPTNHKVEGCFEWTKYINDNHAFGTRNMTDGLLAAQSMHFTTYSNRYHWGVDGTTEHYGGTFTTGKHTIVFNEDDGNGGYQAILDGTVIDNVKISGFTEIVLFGRGSVVNFSGYFHYFKIWDLDTGELLAHYVPAYENGVQGLFDKVANKMVKVASGMVCEGETIDYAKRWEQVDTQPAPVGWPEYDCPIVVVSCRMIDDVSEPRYIRSSEPAGMAILEKLNDLYRKGVTLFLLRILTPDQQHIGYLDVLMAFEGNTVGINSFELPKFFSTYQYLMPSIESYMSISNGQVVANGNNYVLRIRNWMIDRYYEIAPKSALNSYAPLSNVLTKNNTTSFTPTGKYHPATKKYVDDAVANTKGFYTYKVDLGNIGFTGETNEYGWITHTVTEQCKTEINDLINKMLTDDIRQPLVVIENTNTEADLKSMLLFGFDTEYNPETMQNLDFTLHGVANYIGSATGSKMMKYENAVMFAGSGIVTDGVWDASVLVIAATTQQSLTTDNEMEYVPTGDYNPATKKYVDDAVANAGAGEDGGNTNSEIPCLYISAQWYTSTTSVSLTSNELSTISEYITAGLNKGCRLTVYGNGISTGILDTEWAYTNTTTTIEFAGIGAVRGYKTLYFYDLKIYGVWSNDIFTANSGTLSRSVIFKDSNYLNKTNTTSYTPTGDYNPATKKYVDDAVAGASGGITEESDPTVPDWAKQPSKPTYTASEVGALPASTVIPAVPTNLSAFNDDLGTSPVHSHSQYLTAHQDISGKQNKVLYGIADPTSDIGTEGDIYVKYV